MADDDVSARRTTKATAAPVKKAPAKKVTVKKAPAKKAPAKKVAAKKLAAKKAPAKKVAAKKVAVKKSAAKKVAVKKTTVKKSPRLRLAAEQTFADEPQVSTEPGAEDTSDRMRGILRAAAARLEAKEGSAPAPPTPAAPPAEADTAVEDQGDWSPPEVLEEAAPTPPPPSAPPPPQPSPPEPPEVVAAPAPRAGPPADEEGRGGAGLSIVAIALAVLVPLVGAIVGFVLANRGRQRGAALAGVARVVSILALVAWLVGGGVLAFATFGDEGVDYSKLKVGDCFDSSSTNEVRGVKVKPCSEPHNSEIFFLVTHPAGPDEPYPGKDTLVQFAADACLGQPLTDYLGIPLEQSNLKDFEIVPQESAWEDGRRVLVCGLDTGGEGRITGSVKGTRR